MSPDPSRVAARHLASPSVSLEVESLREIVELIDHEAKGEFGRDLRKSTIKDNSRGGASLVLVFSADLERVQAWAKEQMSHNYSGQGVGWTLYDGHRKVRI